jgi:serine/threonine-protein kinase HipA
MHLMPSCLRDVLPDACGRRLIDYQYPHIQKNELDYGMLSGSDRIGALDFQASATEYKERSLGNISLKAIDELAIALETNHDFTKSLAPVLLHGTSIGGARPKCLITIDHLDYIAKFSLSTDYYPFLRSEFLAMRLAKLVGINVADVTFKEIYGRDILLVERFDRYHAHNKCFRKIMLSGLSLLGLDELEARYASYIELADVIRIHFSNPTSQLHELYQRLVFNILVGNTDDHARNHAAFWDGKSLLLTPAYDICPQMRTGFEATQAMLIDGIDGQHATLINALSICDHFLLTEKEARKMINHQIKIIDKHWLSLCNEAKLNKREQNRLLGSVIKSEFCLQDWK